MTAPFDLPAGTITSAPAGTLDFGCCSRAAVDAPPALVGEAALVTERMLESLFRVTRKVVQESARALRQRPWI